MESLCCCSNIFKKCYFRVCEYRRNEVVSVGMYSLYCKRNLERNWIIGVFNDRRKTIYIIQYLVCKKLKICYIYYIL